MMTKTTRAAWMAGASQPFAATPNLMVRGPAIYRDKDAGGGDGGEGEGEGDEDEEGGEGQPETVDKAGHDALVRAHELLKKDARKGRARIRELEADVERLTTEVETLQQQADGNVDIATKIKTAVDNAKAPLLAEIEALKKGRESDRRVIETNAIENALNAQFDEIGVKPEFKDAVKALLRDQIEVDYDDEEDYATISLSLNSLPLAEGFAAWAKTEKGKVFVAEGNSGGGANGGKRGRVVRNPWKDDAFSLTEQSRLEASDPVLANRLKAEAGVA